MLSVGQQGRYVTWNLAMYAKYQTSVYIIRVQTGTISQAIYGFPFENKRIAGDKGSTLFCLCYLMSIPYHLVLLWRNNENSNKQNFAHGALRQHTKSSIWSCILMVFIYWSIADNTLWCIVLSFRFIHWSREKLVIILQTTYSNPFDELLSEPKTCILV